MGLAGYNTAGAEQRFVDWETATPDCIDLKRAYVDVAGDLAAGVLLSQIVHWHLPAEHGGRKLAVQRKGRYWLAKRREDWWEECRLRPHQYDAAVELLRRGGLVQTAVFRFDGVPTVHIALCWEALCARLLPAVVDVVPEEVAARLQPFPDVVLGAGAWGCGQVRSEVALRSDVAVPAGEAPVRLVELVLAPINALPVAVISPAADAMPNLRGARSGYGWRGRGKVPVAPVEFSRVRRLDFKESAISISTLGEHPITETTAEIGKANHPYPSCEEGSAKSDRVVVLGEESPAVRLAVARVMAELGMTARRVERGLADVMAQHRKRERMSPEECADQMLAAWREYEGVMRLMKYEWGPRSFLLDGHWLRANSWPYDRVRMGAMVGSR